MTNITGRGESRFHFKAAPIADLYGYFSVDSYGITAVREISYWDSFSDQTVHKVLC